MNKQLIEVIATGIWNGEKFHTDNRGVYKSMLDETKVLSHRRAEAALKAINDAGFVVVPKEPTKAMINASGCECGMGAPEGYGDPNELYIANDYKYMLKSYQEESND